MVSEISARHALTKEVIEEVSERTGGVPLFVEEVTRLLLERGVEGGAQAIPPTLQQSLAARLDRLGEAREIAQIGAVLGREFAYGLIRDVADADEPALQASLDRLAEADLLFVEGAPPEASYRFKHALVQDAAYDSLLKSRRQALHRRAAEVLRDDPEARGGRARSRSRIISLKPASTTSPSNGGARRATRRLRRSAFQEAIAHLGKAIDYGGQGGRRLKPGAETARRLRQRADRGARLCSARNDRSLHKSPRVCGRRHGHARPIRCRLRPVGRQRRAGRAAGDEEALGGILKRR